jgi:signal transduction histidine kinase
MTYLAAAVASSGVFVIAGRRSKQAADTMSAPERTHYPDDTLWHDVDIDCHQEKPQADLAAALCLVLKRLAPSMAGHCVQAELAAPAGLLVRMHSGPLVDLLEELVTASIHAAPASRILLAAAARGEHIYLSVTDDMPGTDAHVRIASLRDLRARLVRIGGSLDITVQPAEGTTVALQLQAVTHDWTTKAESASSQGFPAYGRQAVF